MVIIVMTAIYNLADHQKTLYNHKQPGSPYTCAAISYCSYDYEGYGLSAFLPL
jgi:hypothetical protein